MEALHNTLLFPAMRCSRTVTLIASVALGCASAKARCLNSSTAVETERISQPQLHWSTERINDYDDFAKLASRSKGVACTYTESGSSGTNQNHEISCDGGIAAIGQNIVIPCSVSDRIGSSLPRHFACQMGNSYTRTNWIFSDKNGQKFLTRSKTWKTYRPFGQVVGRRGRRQLDRCYGGRTLSTLRVLDLRAGNTNLYFIREIETTYKPERVPSL